MTEYIDFIKRISLGGNFFICKNDLLATPKDCRERAHSSSRIEDTLPVEASINDDVKSSALQQEQQHSHLSYEQDIVYLATSDKLLLSFVLKNLCKYCWTLLRQGSSEESAREFSLLFKAEFVYPALKTLKLETITSLVTQYEFLNQVLTEFLIIQEASCKRIHFTLASKRQKKVADINF